MLVFQFHPQCVSVTLHDHLHLVTAKVDDKQTADNHLHTEQLCLLVLAGDLTGRVVIITAEDKKQDGNKDNRQYDHDSNNGVNHRHPGIRP